MFGWADLVALMGPETIAVQVTTRPNMGARIKKILASDTYPICIRAGWRIECHGWYKSTKHGQKRGQWACEVRDLTDG
jgi:hypothetical protein